MDTNYNVLRLVKASLWGIEAFTATEKDYEEMSMHAITTLMIPILPKIHMSEQIRELWKKAIIQQIAFSSQIKYAQENIPIKVPYVILKGTSAAQYYPYPEYRIMGDIDIMTRREDFDLACKQLIEGGYKLVKESVREDCFVKNGIVVELHHFYASLNQPKQSQFLDDLIIENITSSHVLPDMINGLTILEHISQHMEHGIGLRHIIDWMMFAHKCLFDDSWPVFVKLADKIGLSKLAIITTKMCEIYLGLPGKKWCKTYNESICKSFLEYVMSCGNFGNKWTNDSDVGKTVFSYIRKPVAAYKWLQERGMENWKAAQKYASLRPFAWIYQTGRYIIKGLRQEGSITSIMEEYRQGKKRIMLFDELGVKQRAKGLVVYKNGKYVKV